SVKQKYVIKRLNRLNMKYLTIRGETKMNEIINAIPEYVITAVISTAIFYAFKYGEAFIHNKALHAKTAQSRELWSFLEQVAMTAVNSLVSADMTGQDKFNKATGLVQTRSEEHTSELQSRFDLVCRLLLEKKNINKDTIKT